MAKENSILQCFPTLAGAVCFRSAVAERLNTQLR